MFYLPEHFIKKNILVLRGSFRPVTKVNIDMFEKSFDIFIKEQHVKEKNTEVIFEITLSNLTAQGEIDESDFMDRAKLLGSLGHTVMISDFKEYYRMVDYLSKYTKEQLGLAMGVSNFVEIFDEQYYEDVRGGILEAFVQRCFDLHVHGEQAVQNGQCRWLTMHLDPNYQVHWRATAIQTV